MNSYYLLNLANKSPYKSTYLNIHIFIYIYVFDLLVSSSLSHISSHHNTPASSITYSRVLPESKEFLQFCKHCINPLVWVWVCECECLSEWLCVCLSMQKQLLSVRVCLCVWVFACFEVGFHYELRYFRFNARSKTKRMTRKYFICAPFVFYTFAVVVVAVNYARVLPATFAV